MPPNVWLPSGIGAMANGSRHLWPVRNEGVSNLVDEIVTRLPKGEAFYAADQVTDQNERTSCAELVRERIMHLIGDEIPYGVAVEVEEWEKRPRHRYIRMTILVEKSPKKPSSSVVVARCSAKSGAMPALPSTPPSAKAVYLDLWVKPRTNWRDDPSALRWLGYRNE
jgi:GTP-binding protein Era